METVAEAAPVAIEAAPVVESQPAEVQAQPQAQSEAPKPVAEGATIDRGVALAEIQARIKADPDTKLNDSDLEIYEEGLNGKLKPTDKPKVEEVKDKVVAPAEDAVAKILKDVGAKSIEEVPQKIADLRKALSGKDAQAVASLTKEIEGYKAKEQAFNGATKLFADAKAGVPAALSYLQKELGIKLPSGSPPSGKPFTEEADLLTDGALSRAWEREQALEQKLNQFESKLTEGEKRVQQEQLQQRTESQVVDEALAVSQLFPELKELPNLRNRIIDFQKGKDDPGLAPLAEVFDYVVQQNKEKGLMLDPETAFYAIRGKNMDALLAAEREAGRKEAYNHKPNKSLSSVTTEDPQTPNNITDEQLEKMGMPGGFELIPKEWYSNNDPVNGRLVKSQMPPKAWPHFGF